MTTKRDGNGTVVYGKNGNDNGKFGFKNGPSLEYNASFLLSEAELRNFELSHSELELN